MYNVPNVTASCVLHKTILCEIHGDEFNEEWLEDTQDGSTSDQLTVPNSNSTDSGVEVREFSNYPL